MGENVEFPSNGDTAGGYLARAPEGAGPGVIVLQEWWGLDSYIKGVCDELSNEGFTALAPDLYHGELAKHTEMDKAAELMNTLPPDRSARDMGGAVNFLTGYTSELAPWLAAHVDVNALDLVEANVELERAAADSVKRVHRART